MTDYPMEKKAFQSFRYSFLKILTGTDLSRRRLPVMEIVSENPGPVLWLTACAHGDEVGGMVVIQETFRKLKKTRLVRGSVHAFPLMNPIGFESGTRHIPFSMEDLNRSYPGNPAGSLAERMAHIILSTLIQTQPSLVIDLHNDWIRSLPYAVLDPKVEGPWSDTYESIKNIGRKTGLPVVCEEVKQGSSEWRKTLSGCLLSSMIPALTLELGEAFVVNERNVEYGVRAIFNLLNYLEMIEFHEPPFHLEYPFECREKYLSYTHKPVVSKSGIIRFLCRPGQIVHQGQSVARVYNAFGKLIETLRAPGHALILGSADSSVALPGMPVIAFGLIPSDDLSGAVKTY
jgi:predicted deacylase